MPEATAIVPRRESRAVSAPTGSVVNDVHSQLNGAVVDRIVHVQSTDELAAVVREVRKTGGAISTAGGRHAMGGQQFGAATTLVDTRRLNRVVDFDATAGIIEAEAGIQWPALMGWLRQAQAGQQRQWGIVQKQTGADRLSLGGALAANIHGRGLRLRPVIGDVESFVLVDAAGGRRRCSRAKHRDLFRLAIGGYGLFGIIASVRLRLAPKRPVERRVEIRSVDGLMAAFERRIAEGFTFGDFQFAIDDASDEFLQTGILSCYRPLPDQTPVPPQQKVLTEAEWGRLIGLAHRDKRRAFEAYAGHYLATDGQIYWSDTHQLSYYLDDYHAGLDDAGGAAHKASEMITEIYVPRTSLERFLRDTRLALRRHGDNLIYGTVRLVECDPESYLAWARQPWACIVFNLHVEHTPEGRARAAASFQRLIDLGIRYGGSYYLTYHRWARRDQVDTCHPRFRSFLELKRRFDTGELFQSDWYRHYTRMFAAG
jgi:FAD/FMN-containing dehydrogenase